MPTKSNNTGGRGGARIGAGRKKSAVKEKVENGNPGGRTLETLDIPEIEGAEMPKPHDFLSEKQRDGNELQAKEIYQETWEWLKKVGCAQKISPQLLERYSMCSARWIQCEELTNKLGLLSKHPTTQKPIPSPGRNIDRKSTRLNSRHQISSYAVFCLKKKKYQLIKTELKDSSLMSNGHRSNLIKV